jgi:hypothetical protein
MAGTRSSKGRDRSSQESKSKRKLHDDDNRMIFGYLVVPTNDNKNNKKDRPNVQLKVVDCVAERFDGHSSTNNNIDPSPWFEKQKRTRTSTSFGVTCVAAHVNHVLGFKHSKFKLKRGKLGHC